MRVSKHQAEEKEGMFEALAAYANMGDEPEDWNRFRIMYPNFFPTASSSMQWPGFRDLTEWMYTFAENWARDFADLPPERRPIPPLLWYRNRLRAVWARNDQHGYGLAILFGIEPEARNIAKKYPSETYYDMLLSPSLVPGQSVDSTKRDTDGGLPPGRPVINGVTGEIAWKFGCEFQQSVYELMQNRWRAKVCPKCGRFFVAAKTAQKTCSAMCSNDVKRQRALAYWNQTGSKRRAKARAE